MVCPVDGCNRYVFCRQVYCLCSEDNDGSGVIVVSSGDRCNTGVFCEQG